MGQQNVFDVMGKYWQEIAEKNSSERQIQFIKDAVSNEGWILDLACGTGRHSSALSKECFNVVGLDVSSTLLRIAKQHQPQAQLVKADMQHLPFKEKTFSATVSLDNSFGYLPTEQADLQSLKELHQTLRQGGLLVLDVFNREQLNRKYPKHSLKNLKWLILPTLLRYPNVISRYLLSFYKWYEYPSFFLLQKRTVDSKNGRLYDFWVTKDRVGGKMRFFNHSTRLYKVNRLQKLLVNAGFVVERVCGGYEGQDLSPKSTRLIVLANAT
ncbi:MAG: class I SAM-dependent methyltransferase [Candidatus Bathyarchaeia archaeon]|jgi:ubiquinone/menaquinone biosynthesis C-methylase UbiE